MAINVTTVCAKFDAITEFAAGAELAIDAKLSDSKYVRDNIRNKDRNPTFHIVLGGWASLGDKEHLIRIYKRAGWGYIAVRNSDENGEASGLVGITLKKYAE